MTILVPSHLRERQTTASDPAASIWVAANAGSGKTHVLTQRVIRLLLSGVAPAKILCLTFTKAAAAQMSTRVFDTLARWTMLDDARLRDAILATGAPAPSGADMLLARRLLTRTIETPGGLKIQTIHAFCERLLHLFPFEANVPARFEVADEKRAEELMSRAKRSAIEAARREDGAAADALARVADLAGSFGLDPLLALALRLRAPVQRHPQDLQATLAARLGAPDARAAAQVRRAVVTDGLPPEDWSDLAARLDRGTANDRKQAARLREALAAYRVEVEGAAFPLTLDAYLKVFVDTSDKPRGALLTKGLAKADPTLEATLAGEQTRILELRDELRIAEAIERTQALLALVDAVRATYERMKSAAGLLDFDDLIERTLRLLERSDAGWVLHKLDAGIDHVLVDEAQDTSEPQWRILEHLTGDFAAGDGASSARRSFFVVGDDKQSIFSFQGAAPAMFDAMRSAFERRFRSGRKPFERVSLKTSFRSVPGILAAVDKVFESAPHQDGLVAPADVWPVHESIKADLPGLIEIWPRVAAAPAPDPADWSIPLDETSERDPVWVVADRIARKVKALIAPGSGEYVHEGGARRPIRAGDILVLVRTRNAFFETVIRALKRHYVEVAGADRLDVARHIAVMDLVAVGRAALLSQDDLSLACVLKSPLFGFTDEDLVALAPNRRGSLAEALATSSLPHHRAAHATLADWAVRAARTTPFAFYIELLGRDGGRRKMESRLGPEAHDAIDEFLRLALAHEREGAPSLVTFLDDVEALDSSIRRDMEGPGDAVRVMTVHAAKGLEAKVVFLPDTCQVPSPRLDPVIFDLNKESGRAPVLVWSPHKADDCAVVAAARAAERLATMREYRRLLYVGLTRAEERLYIAGFYNVQEPPADCWNAMIEAAFPDAPEVPAFWDEAQTLRRIVSAGHAPAGAVPRAMHEQHPLRLAPEWLTRPVAPAPSGPAALRATQRVGAATPERRRRLGFGTGVHLLLQHLPAFAAEIRAAQAQKLLAQRADVDAADVATMIAEAEAVLAMAELAPLFTPQARTEVAVIGRVGDAEGAPRLVNGVVDRLVVEPARVLVCDFKTGAPSPTAERENLRQLALYRDVLAPLWPDRPLVAWLVWTRERRIVPLV